MKPGTALRALLVLAALRLLLYILINAHYGFHRDELATVDDARHLAWGYVAYPPLTPFVARIAMAVFGPLFGTVPAAVRFFTALAQCVAMVVTGLMTRELGGGRAAQILAALAGAVSPISLLAGHLFQYVSFDYLWAVLATYFVIRLLESDDGRWWMVIGVAVGLGFMTRYTIAWLVAGLAVGFLLTPARKLLWNKWLVLGVALALMICLPNFLWQASHGFISIDFLRSIHARDIRIGRTDGFLWKQILVPTSVLTVPLWSAGLWFYFRKKEGQRYRALGWTFVATLALFAAAQARDYYTAPLYPMLLAAGAVVAERWPRRARQWTWAGVAASAALGIAFVLPTAPMNSRLFLSEIRLNGDLREEIGWTDLVDQVTAIRDSLPADERSTAGILTSNFGEAGAIDLYGPAHRLPQALSVVNSYWLRGYGEHPPQTLIIVGLSPAFVEKNFTTCEYRGTILNRYGVANEETEYDRYLWVCRGLREPWPEFWRRIKTWA